MSVAAPAPALDLGAALEERVAALWWQLTRELPGDLSRSAASLLAALRSDGPQRVTALAARESISQPAMSLLVQRLERGGLVIRSADPSDRRASQIAITPSGETALRVRAEARSAWLAARLDTLAVADRAALEASLGAFDALIGCEVAA